MSTGRLTQDIGRDARLALRQLGRRRGFAAAAVLTLALGIGAPTAIFAIVHAVLLRPLPFRDASHLVTFRVESQSRRGPIAFDALPVDLALTWADTSSTLAALAVHNDAARTFTTRDGPVRLTGLAATPNLFDVLGTRPFAGHIFADAGDLRQVVLSHRTWQQQFAGDLAVVGAIVRLDGQPYRITGVMPDGFDFPTPETAFWVPVALSPGGSRGMILPAVARLRPGATPAAAAEEGQRHLAQRMGHERGSLSVRSLQDQMVGGVRRTLWLLMAAVSVVSVLATVNIALLLLAHGAGRGLEFAVRLALGAARGRLVRQVCVEGVVLSLLGGLAGLVVAVGATAILVRIAPPEVPRLHETSFDTSVLLFSAVLVVTASVIFGVLSAGRVVTGDALRALSGASGESRLVGAGIPRRRLHVFAAAELALAMVLLVGAGLLLHSVVVLMLVDQGFDSRGRVALQVTLPAARYPGAAARLAFHDRFLERLRQVRGVTAAGLITSLPNRQPTGRFAYDPVTAPIPSAEPGTIKLAEVRMASEDFLEAMGIPLLAGRGIQASDRDAAEPVIVISRALAEAHFPEGGAVGRMLYSDSGDRRVVGVVGDVRPATTGALQYDPAAYVPLRQALNVLQMFSSMHIVVHGQPREALVSQARAIVRSLDADLPLFNVRTLDDEVAELVAGPRFTATVLGLFALVALVMAAIGVYGVMAYSASRRAREVGIRIALGATRGQVLWLMVRDGVLVVGAGLVAGLIIAMWLVRSLTGVLHDIGPANPSAIAAVAGLLGVTGLAAAYLPARRATRVSVLAALREE
jgi:putative ABC transport system permease protein